MSDDHDSWLRRLHFTAHGVLAFASRSEPSNLSQQEQEQLASLSPVRQVQFQIGRTGLRKAIAALGAEVDTIASTVRGAPLLPAPLVGSISHKGELAAAVVAHDSGWQVGIDLEHAAAPRVDLSKRILTERELRDFARLAEHERGLHLTRVFAVKEAIYKAIDPFVLRYVGFREVELQWSDGQALVPQLQLDGNRFEVDVAELRFGPYWVMTARARRT